MEYNQQNFERLLQENTELKADIKDLKQATYNVLQILGVINSTGEVEKFSKMKFIKTITTSVMKLFDGDNFLEKPINIFLKLYEKYKQL